MMGYVVKDVVIEEKEYEYVKPFSISLGTHFKEKNVEIKLILDDGTEGLGEASPSFFISGETGEILMGISEKVRDILMGRDVRSYRKIWEDLEALKATPAIKAGAQFAVLDALCKKLDIPPYQFLGGERDEIETDKTIGIGKLDEMVEEAKEIGKEGFRVIKVKVGTSVEEDVEKVVRIQEAVPDVELVVDANQGYKPKEAVAFAREIYKEGVKVKLFEQPVLKWDIEGLRFVRYNCPYPVAADESVFTRYDAYRLVKEDCVDYINIKLMKSGLLEALAIVEIAKSANVKLMIGCMGETSLGISQSAHFAGGLGAFSHHDLDSHLLIKEKEFRGRFKQEGPILKLY